MPTEDGWVTAEDVKEAMTMFDVLDICDIPHDGVEGKIMSIYHDERTPSLHVYEDHWWDYSVGKGGDIIAFVQEYTGSSFRLALQYLERGVDFTDYKRKPVKRKPREVKDFSYRFMNEAKPFHVLDKNSQEWFRTKIFKRWGLSHHTDLPDDTRFTTTAIWTPHYGPEMTSHTEYAALTARPVTAVKIRDMVTRKKTGFKGGTFHEMYNPWTLPYYRYGSVLCEGESDAWVAKSAWPDFFVAATPSGARSAKPEWLEKLPRPVYVLFDVDQAGNDAYEAIKWHLGDDHKRIMLPYDDLGEVNVKSPAWFRRAIPGG